LLDAVGMPWVHIGERSSGRSPEFRSEIVRLYEHRCAMCGFDGRLGGADLALEAAHIMWHALGGPDDPQNGLLLCSIHHKALDRGAVGVSEDRRILVSQELHGGSQVAALITRLSGQPVRPPVDPASSPGSRFVAWHYKEVFRKPSRPAA
jgi:putative restriction endonuclease